MWENFYKVPNGPWLDFIQIIYFLNLVNVRNQMASALDLRFLISPDQIVKYAKRKGDFEASWYHSWPMSWVPRGSHLGARKIISSSCPSAGKELTLQTDPSLREVPPSAFSSSLSFCNCGFWSTGCRIVVFLASVVCPLVVEIGRASCRERV